MRIPNWPVLTMALEFIIDHPEKYDQSQWKCGSTRCVAGWIAELSGGVWEADSTCYIWPRGTDPEIDEPIEAELAALQALGIVSYEQDNEENEVADMLFLGTLPWRDVLRNVEILADEDQVTLSPKIMAEIVKIAILEGSH